MLPGIIPLRDYSGNKYSRKRIKIQRREAFWRVIEKIPEKDMIIIKRYLFDREWTCEVAIPLPESKRFM